MLILARGTPCAAFCGDTIFEPGEECETGPNGDAACARACVVPGQPDECTCATPPLTPASYALIADVSARLSANSKVMGGHVAVLRSGGALTIGSGSQVVASQQVVADRIHMRDGATIGRRFANQELLKEPVAVGDGPYRFQPPLALVPALPVPETAIPGMTPIVVQSSPAVLAPGAYAVVVLAHGTVLHLRGTDPGTGSGTYDFRSLEIQSEARLIADNPVNLRILDRLVVATRGTIEPLVGATTLAGDFRVTVGGPLVRLGHSSTARIHLRLPTGTLRIGRNASVVGRIVAAKVTVGGGAHLDAEGGCGDGVLNVGEPCDVTAAGGTSACQTTPCAAPGHLGQCTCHCNAAAECNDGDPCTTDSCTGAGACTHTLVPCP